MRPVGPGDPLRAHGVCGPALARLEASLALDGSAFARMVGAATPMARAVTALARARSTPLVVGVSGGQGSGKTTLAAVLETLLTCSAGLRVVRFSLDDFYLSRRDRRTLATDVHPLLVTRGVPGTHDAARGVAVLRGLTGGPSAPIRIPGFDKARDEPVAAVDEAVVEGPVDVVLFEGWCVGIGPEPDERLTAPVNALEASEDPDGIWRRWVNGRLSGPYREWFALIDLLVFLQVPDFEAVRRWRTLQERGLSAARPGGEGVMTDAEVGRFVMHYERLTRHALRTLPDQAAVVAHLDEAHRITHLSVADRLAPAARTP